MNEYGGDESWKSEGRYDLWSRVRHRGDGKKRREESWVEGREGNDGLPDERARVSVLERGRRLLASRRMRLGAERENEMRTEGGRTALGATPTTEEEGAGGTTTLISFGFFGC